MNSGTGRTNAAEIRAQQAAVERFRHDGAAGNRRARHVAAVIRMRPARKELHIGACAKIVDRGRPGLQIGVAQIAIGRLPDQRRQIASACSALSLKPATPALAIARNPKRAGRRRSGAADLIGFLAQEHVEALERGDQRSGHSGRSGARDQEIDFQLALHPFSDLTATPAWS